MANQPSRIVRQDGTIAESENPERRGFSREDFTDGASAPSSSQKSVHPPTQRLSGPIRPVDLRDYNGPLFVINKTTSMVSHDDGKGNVMRIEPVYHRDHIAQLPIEVANHTGFQRLWRTGRIQVTTDPEIEDYLTLAESPEDNGGILPFTMEAGQDKDLSPLECLVCGELVFLSKEDLDNGIPALCDAHVDSVDLLEEARDANDRKIWKLKETAVRRSDIALKRPDLSGRKS